MANGKARFGALDLVLVVVPLIALIAVKTFAGPCIHDDGSAAACTGAGDGIMWVSIVATVLALVRLFVPSRAGKIALAVAVAALGVAIALIPGTIMPLCMMETMHCQALMKPTAMVLGVLTAIVGVAGAVLSARAGKASRRAVAQDATAAGRD